MASTGYLSDNHIIRYRPCSTGILGSIQYPIGGPVVRSEGCLSEGITTYSRHANVGCGSKQK